MTAFALLFTLSAIGIAETVYLIRSRIASEKPVCVLGKSCSIVLESKYKRLLIIDNDILGLLFYIVCAIISAFLVIGIAPTHTWEIVLRILAEIGSLLSILLTYIQWRVIKAWCFWCLMSAFTIWFIRLIILLGM